MPLVRRAKKRKFGCSTPTQKAGETATPVGWMASDLASLVERTLKVSLPEATAALVSDQPEVPDSKCPFETS